MHLCCYSIVYAASEDFIMLVEMVLGKHLACTIELFDFSKSSFSHIFSISMRRNHVKVIAFPLRNNESLNSLLISLNPILSSRLSPPTENYFEGKSPAQVTKAHENSHKPFRKIHQHRRAKNLRFDVDSKRRENKGEIKAFSMKINMRFCLTPLCCSAAISVMHCWLYSLAC